MAGGGIASLKEQVETNQASMEASLQQMDSKTEQIKARQDTMESKLDQMQAHFDKQFNWIRSKLDPTDGALNTETPMVDPTHKGLLPNPIVTNARGGTAHPVVAGTEGSNLPLVTHNQPNNFRSPRYEFPMFDGEDDVVDWLQQCECFFFINETTKEQRVPSMTLYLKGKGRKWFFTSFKTIHEVSWELFKKEATKRFAEQGYRNTIAELHDLKQVGTVEEYQSKFEDLKAQVLEQEPSLTETYFIAAFVGGLQGELKNFVHMLKPSTLETAITLSRLQEGGFNTLLSKAKTLLTTRNTYSNPTTKNYNTTTPSNKTYQSNYSFYPNP